MNLFIRKNLTLLIILAVLAGLFAAAANGMESKDFVITLLRGLVSRFAHLPGCFRLLAHLWPAGCAQPGARYALHDRRLHRLDRLRQTGYLCRLAHAARSGLKWISAWGCVDASFHPDTCSRRE